MRNARGFALTGALVLMPLLLAVVALVAGALIAISAHRAALHACRTSTLAAQAELARGLKALLALNPEAERLRAQLKVAQAAAQTAPDPISRAAAVAQVAALRLQQAMLDARQRGLIALSEARARAAVAQGASSVGDSYRRASRIAGKAEISASFRRSPRMILKRSPSVGLAPSYFADARAEREQVAALSWSIRLASLLPSWMPLSREARLAETDGRCAASVENKEFQWQPRLAPDRAP